MAESKAKPKASGKPVSAVAETKSKAKTKTVKPAVAKAAAKPKVAKVKEAAPVASKAAAKSRVKASNPAISAEQRYRMVAEAAYYIAERRNFAPGDAAADWAQAEMQIVALLNRK